MIKTFYAKTREEWREWLVANYQTESEIYFIFPSIRSGEAGVSYNDAVEEALCFGWIDGVAKAIDEFHGSRRFTPRRKGSSYSRPNIERLIWLDKNNMLIPSVKIEVEKIINTPYLFPLDIVEEIKKDEIAFKNYNSFSESYKRIRVSYIDDARNRPEEFEKRLKNFIDKTRDNKLIIGFGGIDKYYK